MKSSVTTQRFRELVCLRFGLRFDEDRLDFLASVLERRASARSVGIERYLADLAVDEIETAALGTELTVGETYFFRHFDQFIALRDEVLPQRLVEIGVSRELRLLSAGCSTGEEPYSLAMLVKSDPAIAPLGATIRAIDHNPVALTKASMGRYGPWSLRETPAQMRSRWFEDRGREVDLDASILQAVAFERGNLTNPDLWGENLYDVIFCRNVIMYFSLDVQRRVAAAMARALVPGGHLFLGHAETLRGLSEDFDLVQSSDAFYYRRRAVADFADRTSPIELAAHRRALSASAAANLDRDWFEAIGRASHRIEALARPAAKAPPGQDVAADVPSVTEVLRLLAVERFTEALALLEAVPSNTDGAANLLVLRALLLLQVGKISTASAICRAILARDEDDPGANYLLGLCFESTGSLMSALLHYDRAAELDPLFAMPVLRRGLLSRRSGQSDAARVDLRRAIDLLDAEDASRLLMFGGGFARGALLKLCESELASIEPAA